MSRTVDERVVSMQFDNQQFERNVATSMGTIDKLKKSLNFDSAAKGLDGLNDATRRFDFSPLSNGVETVREKFSALEIMAVTALANITNSAVNAGKRLVSAFTIDPIKSGFQEYETQINAVQTILANTQSKGTTLDQVNDALDTLNTYADKTIYNFTEMTRNIGTFTAAGIDLDTSVNAIQGIANLAATSGSTSQQASTAMYQLSQALASGTVKLMDWNSVVNAGMGGQVFQDALKETARVHGVAIDDMIKKEGSFRETLSSGWLTSDILTETLQHFTEFTDGYNEETLKAQGYTEEQIAAIKQLGITGTEAATKVKTFTQLMDTLKEAAQSGWTQTWEILVGDFEEAKSLLTSVSDYFSDVLGKSAEARNTMLQSWKDMGGRAVLIDSVKNAFNGLLNIIKPIKEAFREVFPPITARQLLQITLKVNQLTRAFRDFTSKHSENIKSAFKGIFDILKTGISIIGKVIGFVVKMVSNFSGVAGAVLSAAGSFGEFLSKISDSVRGTELFKNGLSKLGDFLQKVIDKVKEFTSAISVKIDTASFDGLAKVLSNIWEIIKNIGSKIGTAISGAIKDLMGVLNNDSIGGALDILNGGLIAGILLNIKKFVGSFGDAGSLIDKVFDGLKDASEGVSSILDSVKDSLSSWQQTLKAEVIKKIAISIGILAASLWVIASIDSEKLAGALGAISVVFAELIGSMYAFTKMDGGVKKLAALGFAMIEIAAAVFILALALKQIGSLNLEEIGKGLLGVGAMLGMITGAAIALSKFAATSSKVFSITKNGLLSSKTKTNFIALGFAMIELAVAIKILASACKDFAELSWEGLAKGVSAIGVILLEFAGFAELLKRIEPEKMVSSAFSLILIGAAMEIFAHVASKFADIDWSTLGKAGAAMAGVLLLAAGFGYLSNYSDSLVKASFALVIMGGAMEIFAHVASIFGGMEWESLGKAGAAMAGILLLAAGFVYLAGMSEQLIGASVSLAIMGGALEIFAHVASVFGGMDVESLSKAGAAIGYIIVMATLFGLVAGEAPGMLAASAALLVMAGALAILTPVLLVLGNMSVGQIAKGLIAMAGAFTIIGIAGALLAPAVVPILALSAAVALFGIACLATGAGIMMLGIGLTSLAAIVPAHLAAIMASLVIFIRGLGQVIASICYAIADSAVAIGAAIKALVLTLVDVIVECAPVIVDGALKLITELLTSLVEYTPQIVTLLADFIIKTLDALKEKLPELINSVCNFLIALIEGISPRIPELIAAGVELVGSIIQGISDALGPIIEQVIKPLAESLGTAIQSIAEGMAPIVESVSQAIQGICDAIVSIVEQISPIIDSITGLLKQLGDTISEVFHSVADVISTCGDTISQVLSSVADTINSVFSGIGDVITSVGDSIRTVLDGIAGIIESIGNAALNAGTGFENLANGVKTITELKLTDLALSMAAVAKGISDIAKHSKGLAEAGTGMHQIAEGTKLTASSFNKISSGLSTVVNGFTSLGPVALTAASSVITAGTTMMTGFARSVQTGMTTVITILTTSVNVMVTLVKSAAPIMLQSGILLMQMLQNGIRTAADGIRSAVATVISNAASAAKSAYSSFYEAGTYVASGFASGISAGTFQAQAAASAMAQAALDAAKSKLQINSPSKVFRAMAACVPEGFAQGITRNMSLVTESSKNMAQTAFDATKDALSRVGELASSDISTSPTIRPVVDMSNVQTGALSLGANINAYLTKPIDSLSQIISDAQSEINASNHDVINAINGLREDLSAMYDTDAEIGLYIDSKKLASSIAKPMNRQLNILAKRGAY